MKLLKRLFSRTAIVLLTILVQLLLYWYILEKLSSSYVYVLLPFRVLGVLFIIAVINRDMTPSAKIPWIIALTVLPIMGTLLYLLLGRMILTRSQRKRLLSIHDRTQKYAVPNNALDELDAVDPSAAGQARYLVRETQMPLYRGTSTHYFPSGEAAFECLKEELSKAQKFIFMEYFIIEEGFMWNAILDILLEKAAHGVEIKLLYDDFGCSGKLKFNYDKKLRQKGIECFKFNKLTPLVSAVHNNRDHRKITVIDGVVGFTGGYNLADEYINATSPFGYWKDSGVCLRGEAVRSLTMMFLRQFAFTTGHELDFDRYMQPRAVVPSRGFVMPFGDGPAPIYPEHIGEEVYLGIINQATRYVYIATPYLIVDYNIIKALKAAARRGVDVRIIVPGVPDKKLVNIMTKSSYYALVSAGVRIYEFAPGFIHAKSFVSDDKIAVVGTINLDYRSLIHHFECGVWMYGTDAVADLRTDYDNTLYKCREINASSARLKFFPRLLASILMLFAPLL